MSVYSMRTVITSMCPDSLKAAVFVSAGTLPAIQVQSLVCFLLLY